MTDRPAERPETAEPPETADSATPAGAYRVLARKYRPANFADLIGQEAMVRTLSNAFASGRLAHAFMLTGVRGVGKTTTARIIARALNCVGPDGAGGPTAEPCGLCEHCQAIAQDRHVDVIEMDAASHTKVEEMRELLVGVRYRPVSARYKVYVIDEVHMLSNHSFNALLKTLEEPPEHVVFIFATTEIRKLPLTVLSRCQRFDLRRVDQAELARHFAGVARQEGVAASDGALAMIARAADGSVRDGLSLLDQAMALGGAAIDEALVKEMLGLADRARIFDLFEAVMRGRAAEALDILGEMYRAGADPLIVLQDALELTHLLTRIKLVPDILESAGLPETERLRGRELAEKLPLPILARTWQILLKGLGETRLAPLPLQAAEMVLIRLIHAADLPSPADLVKRLRAGSGDETAKASGADGPARADKPSRAETPTQGAAQTESLFAAPRAAIAGRARTALEPEAPPAGETGLAPEHAPESRPAPRSFEEVVDGARDMKEGVLAEQLARAVHLVHFEPGRIEFRPSEQAPRDLAGSLGRFLQDWTGRRWLVSVSGEAGAPPLRAQRDAAESELRAAAERDPLVQAVTAAFPGAKIVARRGGRPPRDQDDAAGDGAGGGAGDGARDGLDEGGEGP